MKKKTWPKGYIVTGEGLRIDFNTSEGEPLGYIRFEFVEGDGVPTYAGTLEKEHKSDLKKLKAAVDNLLKAVT